MIDTKARERIIRERQNKGLINQLVSSLRPQEKPDTITEPINKVAEGVQRGGNISTILVAFVQAILKAVKDIKVSSPTSSDVQKVSEAIKGLKFPETEIPDNVTLNPIQQKELVSAIKAIEVNPKVEVNVPDVKVPEIKLPTINVPQIKVPEVKVPQIDFSPLLKAIEKIKLEQPRANPQIPLDITPVISAINELGDLLVEMNQPVKFPKHISIDNFPPQYIPPAVTHININSLKGNVLATAMTVGTTAVPIPSTPLSFRRSLIFFNNDSSKTLYFGDSGVTTSTGVPVLAQTYSPALDSGPLQIVYGVSTGDVDVRVFEVSDEDSGR